MEKFSIINMNESKVEHSQFQILTWHIYLVRRNVEEQELSYLISSFWYDTFIHGLMTQSILNISEDYLIIF